MTYTTDDCKEFLIKQYPETKKSDWKRVRKYKDRFGVVCRDFKGNALELCLKETPEGLVEINDINYLNQIPPKVMSHVDLSEMLFGGGKTKTIHLTNVEDKFLNVLKHGIDWENKEFERSSKDFAKDINFNTFVQSHPNLLNEYMEYAYGAITFIYDLDETYMPYHLTNANFDDSLVDVLEVLKMIKKAYVENGMPINIDKNILKNIISSMHQITEMMCCEDDDQLNEVYQTVESVGQKLKQL